MITRRDFLKTMSLLGGAVLTPVRWLGKWAGVEPAQAEEPEVGELYAGFVLLPDGAPLPAFIQHPKLPPPNMCGVGADEKKGIHLNTVSRAFDSVDGLSKEISFPVYTVGYLPTGVKLGSAILLGYETDEVYGASIGFDTYNLETNNEECVMSLWAQPDFFRPFPVWFSEAVEPDGVTVTPQTVDFLPGPGIMVLTQSGVVFHWIRNETLYILNIDPVPMTMDPQGLFKSLGLVEITS